MRKSRAIPGLKDNARSRSQDLWLLKGIIAALRNLVGKYSNPILLDRVVDLEETLTHVINTKYKHTRERILADHELTKASPAHKSDQTQS